MSYVPNGYDSIVAEQVPKGKKRQQIRYAK